MVKEKYDDKKILEDIFLGSLELADPAKKLEDIEFDPPLGRLFFVSVGKGAGRLAKAFNKTYRERLKEAKSRGDKAPILFIDYTHVLKYTDGRVAFLDSVIDTSDEEAVKDINKNLQLNLKCA